MATIYPDRATALASPLRAFPSWYLRMECAACGRERYLAETLLTISRPRRSSRGGSDRPHDANGCGGKHVELITGIPGSHAWQRRIVLMSSPLD
jgi:hypothetical protein